MPRRSTVLAQLLRLGVRYAPLAYQGLKQGQAPAREFAQARLTRRHARTMALEHAAHLLDGSILPVYEGDTRVWVVFSGDDVVGTHPVARTPIDALLAHYDLSKRSRPGSPARVLPPVSRLGGKGRRTATPPNSVPSSPNPELALPKPMPTPPRPAPTQPSGPQDAPPPRPGA